MTDRSEDRMDDISQELIGVGVNLTEWGRRTRDIRTLKRLFSMPFLMEMSYRFLDDGHEVPELSDIDAGEFLGRFRKDDGESGHDGILGAFLWQTDGLRPMRHVRDASGDWFLLVRDGDGRDEDISLLGYLFGEEPVTEQRIVL